MSGLVGFSLVLAVLAVLLGTDVLFAAFYLVAGVYLVSRIVPRRAFKSLRASRSLQQRAFLGDKITVSLNLENPSRLPIPWLMFSDSFPVELATPPFHREVIALGSRTRHTASYTLSANRRGYYQIGPLTLCTGDVLGAHQEMTACVAPDFLIVYPKIVPIAQLCLPTHSPQAVLPTSLPLFEDTARPMGVHDYQLGDNPRHIHWPASASTGRLLVRHFQPAIARDNAIFLNLSRHDYAARGFPEPAIELAITTAASLAHHMALTEGTPVGLFTHASDPLAQQPRRFSLPPRPGRAHLMQILEVLARVRSLPDDTNFPESVRQQAVHLAWGTLIIAMTSHPDEELLETLLFLRRAGFLATQVLVDPPRSRQPKLSRSPEQV